MNKNIIILNKKYKYKICVKYFSPNIKSVNKIIENKINNITNEFINVSKRTVQLNIYYTLYITYEKYNYKNITSLLFNISMDTGGTHPINYIKTLCFRNNTVIDIDYLVNKNRNILINLSNLSRKKLLPNDDGNITSIILDSTRPTKNNFKNFLFTYNGLIIIFDYYQIAPYYYGIKKILIPYELISE